LLYLLHDPQGCGECREMTGSFPVLAATVFKIKPALQN
jgi:hypothetical protein